MSISDLYVHVSPVECVFSLRFLITNVDSFNKLAHVPDPVTVNVSYGQQTVNVSSGQQTVTMPKPSSGDRTDPVVPSEKQMLNVLSREQTVPKPSMNKRKKDIPASDQKLRLAR